MVTFTLEAILAIFLVIVLMRLFRKDPKAIPAAPAYQAPVEDLANLKVTDARTGDVLSIAGAGDRMSDLDFTVDRGTRMEAGARTWVELSGPYKERRWRCAWAETRRWRFTSTPPRLASRWTKSG